MAANDRNQVRRVSSGVPSVSIYGARYTNPYLRSHPELRGTRLVVALDPSDLRRVKCQTQDGVMLPDLHVTGAWKAKRLSLVERRSILRAMRTARLAFDATCRDPIEVYREYLVKSAPSGNR